MKTFRNLENLQESDKKAFVLEIANTNNGTTLDSDYIFFDTEQEMREHINHVDTSHDTGSYKTECYLYKTAEALTGNSLDSTTAFDVITF